jgi:hypothetical protein
VDEHIELVLHALNRQCKCIKGTMYIMVHLSTKNVFELFSNWYRIVTNDHRFCFRAIFLLRSLTLFSSFLFDFVK